MNKNTATCHEGSTEDSTAAPADVDTLPQRYRDIRGHSEALCRPLETEDYVIQSMPDASPTRWHLAHTTWFFETFVLSRHAPAYQAFDASFDYLFNSYYNTVGAQFPRPGRGLLSRPTVREILEYRRHVDRAVGALLSAGTTPPAAAHVVELGLQHEQQHQELMLTDLKHLFSCNPQHPVYQVRQIEPAKPAPLGWIAFEEGLRHIGHDGSGFGYDNEFPRHRTFVPAFELANRLVTHAEYLDFIEDGGYRTSALWLSEGWSRVQQEGWTAPLYWIRRDDGWMQFTLSGLRPLDPTEPVCHVSYFEADAYARWLGVRLPTEADWEVASESVDLRGNFVEQGVLHPLPCAGPAVESLQQLFGDVWEWTASPYVAYPGFRPPDGALGEYNGKFMCNQFVLRGGSCGTPQSHIRRTYRNFWPPQTRFQFSGIRLAR